MPTLHAAVGLYLQHLKMTRAISTYRNNRFTLGKLCDFVSPDAGVEQFTLDDFLAFMDALVSDMSRNTQRTFGISTKAFFNWCVRQGYIEHSPLRHYRVPKAELRTDRERSISDDDLKKLLRYAYTRHARDFAIITLLASSGARIGAILRLRLQNLDLQQRCAEVIEKGGVLSVINFNAATAMALKRYLKERPQPDPEHGFVWCQLYRKAHAPLTYRGIDAMLKLYSERAGCSRPVSAHQFRHKVGQDWSRRPDVAPVDTQNKLNHIHFDTTYQYYYARQSDKVAELTDSYQVLPDDVLAELYMMQEPPGVPKNVIEFPRIEEFSKKLEDD